MSQITTRIEAGVALCTMAPPGGFMNAETVGELDAAITALAGDEAVRAIVLTGGEEGFFIRHYDVRELEKMARELRARGRQFSTDRPVKERPIDLLFRRIGEAAKPVIAGINGSAMGGGLELALACDIRIAQAGPFALGLPEVRLGILPGAGGTQRLSRLIGPDRALEMMLRGRTVSPEEALSLGLVHEVAADARGRALAVGREMAAKSPRAVAHIKRLVHEFARGSLEDGLAAERTLFLDLLVSDEAVGLMEAFNSDGADLGNFGDA